MSDNINVLDATRQTVTLATKDLAGVEYYKMMLVNSSGTILEFNDLAEIGVVPHVHSGHGSIHFHVENISATTTYILVDMSDTTNYPHGANPVSLHIDSMTYQVDADNTADYQIDFYYLENVDGTDGDLRMWFSIVGNKTAGNSVRDYIDWSASGPVMKSGTGGTKSSSNMITLDDPDYSSADNYKSTHNVAVANTPCGSGDIVMKVVMAAGSINLALNLSYHSHDASHP